MARLTAEEKAAKVAAEKAAKAAAKARARRKKVSLLLPDDLCWRLTSIADRLGRDRSEFAAEIIDGGLSRYDLDKALRQFTGEEDGQRRYVG